MSADSDRALVAAAYDSADAQLERVRAQMATQLAELRVEWSSGVAHHVPAAEAVTRQHQEASLAYLPAASHELVQPGEHGASPTGLPVPPDAPLAGQPTDPRAAELERARAIKDMDMTEYARRREEFGVRSPESMSRLFGATR